MKIIYTDKQDELHIITPTPEGLKIMGLEGIMKKDIPEDAIEIMIVNDEAIPTDRYFRTSWKSCKVKGIRVDLNEAKEFHLNSLRQTRNIMLDKLDKRQARYIVNKDKVDKIEVDKNVLRDLPVKIKKDLKDMVDLNKIKNYKPKELDDK